MTLLPLSPKSGNVWGVAFTIISFCIGAYVGIRVEETKTQDALESLKGEVHQAFVAHETLDETRFAQIGQAVDANSEEIRYLEHSK